MQSDNILRNSVVRIECDGDLGVAFLVNKDTLLTAYHVIKKYKVEINEIKVIYDVLGDNIGEASVFCYDEEIDIAILKINEPMGINNFLKVNSYQIEENIDWRSYVCFLPFSGTGNIFEKELIKGKVYQNEDFANKKYDVHLGDEYLKEDWFETLEGCSGSPLVINDNIVGIIVKEENSVRKAPLKAISIKKVMKFLQKNGIKINCEPIDSKPNCISEHDIKTPKYFYSPVAKADEFYEREFSVEEIHRNFTKQNILVLKGMSGVGKTQLAIQYLHKYQAEFNLIFFIRADKKVNIVNDFLTLAQSLGVEEKDEDTSIIIQKTLNWLYNNEKWILVFDNAHEFNDIYKFMPNTSKGRIIITTKNSTWLKYNPKEIEVFENEDASKFLLKLTGQENEVKSKELAGLLGGLPLALVQSAAYMRISNTKLEEYVELFKQYKINLFDENYLPEEYENKVNIVWKISLDMINEISPVSIKLIYFLSFFSSNKIPITILKENLEFLNELLTENINIIDYNKAVTTLKKYSLIDMNDKYISMHCLVQASVQNELCLTNEINEYLYKASTFLDLLLPNNMEETKKWEGIFELLPHAYAIVQHIKENEENKEIIINLLYKVALILRVMFQLDEAKNKIEQSIELAKHYYGNEANVISKHLNLLAGILKDRGDLQDSKKIYEDSLNILLKKSDYTDPNLSITRNNLAIISLNQGDYYKAQELFLESLRFAKIDDEFNKGFIATTLSNLSIVNCNLGDYDAAFDNIRDAIDLAKEEYGECNIHYSRCVNNLGYILYQKKDYIQAKEKYEQAIEIDEKFYGVKHPEVARKKANLVTCLIELNELDEAEQILNLCIEINNNSFGKKSIQFADNINSLGIILKRRKSINDAIKKFREALNISKEILGNVHPTVSIYLVNLATALEEVGEVSEVYKLYKESLDIDKNIYGDNHKCISQKLQTIGQYLYEKKAYNKSKKYIMEALKLNVKIYGRNSINVANNYNILGMIEYKTNMYDKAYNNYEKALQIHLKHYNKNSEIIALDYNNLAMTLNEIGGKSKAKEFMYKSMEIVNSNLSINKKNSQIIKNNWKIIYNLIDYDFLEELKKYKFEFIEKDDTLLIKPSLKKI